jgi:hypothetical protein
MATIDRITRLQMTAKEINSPTFEQVSRSGDSRERIVTLNQLLDVLERSDPKTCRECLSRLRTMINADAYQMLEHRIDTYDYEDAAMIVKEMIQEENAGNVG